MIYIKFEPTDLHPRGETISVDGECETVRSWLATGGRKVSKKEFTETRVQEARDELLRMIQPGDSVQVVCTKEGKSRDGMPTNHYRVFVPDTFRGHSRPYARDVTRLYLIAVNHYVDGEKQHGPIKMGGCGYSKAFQIVYDLGGVLWPDGTSEPHGVRNGHPDSDGHYALKQV